MAVTLRDLQPLEFAQVRRSGDEPLFNLNYAQGPRRAAWAVWGLSLR
jgi:hypothetical protein